MTVGNRKETISSFITNCSLSVKERTGEHFIKHGYKAFCSDLRSPLSWNKWSIIEIIDWYVLNSKENCSYVYDLNVPYGLYFIFKMRTNYSLIKTNRC